MNFDELTEDQKLRLHEAELGLMKGDIDSHEVLIVKMLNLLATLVERYPGALTENATEIRSLLFEREQSKQQRPAMYYRKGRGRAS